MTTETKCPLCEAVLTTELTSKFYYCSNCHIATRSEENLCETNPEWFGTEWANSPATKREFLHRVKHTYKLIKKLEGVRSVLDVGCGNGILVHFLNDKGYWAHGIDSSNEAISIAREKDKWHFTTGTIDSTSETKFDLITLMEVLEHIQYPKQLIHSIKKRLEPGGYLIIEVPNLAAQDSKSLWRRHLSATEYNTDHKVAYTPVGLIKFLTEEGFEIKKLTTVTYAKHMLLSLGTIQSSVKKPLGFIDGSKKTNYAKKVLGVIHSQIQRCTPFLNILLYPATKFSQLKNKGAVLVVIGQYQSKQS